MALILTFVISAIIHYLKPQIVLNEYNTHDTFMIKITANVDLIKDDVSFLTQTHLDQMI